MDCELRNQLLDCFGRIYDAAKECKLEKTIFNELDAELTTLSGYFNVTKPQSLLIGVVFAMSYKEDNVEMHDLISHFNCNPAHILKYIDDFKTLFSKRIFVRQKSGKIGRRVSMSGERFKFNNEIAEQIFQNKPYTEIPEEESSDVIDLLRKVNSLYRQREDEEIDTDELFRSVKDIVAKYQQFPFIEWVGNHTLPVPDTCLFLHLVWKTLTGCDTIDITDASAAIFDDPCGQIRFTQQILFGDSLLIKAKLIEIDQGNFFNDTHVVLTESASGSLRDFGIRAISARADRKSLIAPGTIVSKGLIFNEEEGRQLGLLKNLLTEENLAITRRRLAARSMPGGITVLFHGESGTGKTESVFQIAKDTNREIMKVEISQSKSMWFGESEKRIKRIFSTYKELMDDCNRTPILLFNEADAIISRRKDSDRSAVAQTENAMQNILLEELERFEGILVATTNLVNNIDTAFDRRFLIKLQFSMPGPAVRAKIWKSKLRKLTSAQCRTLAELYNFTGAQIDNVVRRYEIESILRGEEQNFEKIIRYCDTETFSRKGGSIGFIKN